MNIDSNWLLRPFMNVVKDFDNYFVQESPTRQWEEDMYYYFQVDIPGFRKSDLNLSLDDRYLKIQGKTSMCVGPGGKIRTISYGHMFPVNSMMETMEAKLENGVLTVKVIKGPSFLKRVEILE